VTLGDDKPHDPTEVVEGALASGVTPQVAPRIKPIRGNLIDGRITRQEGKIASREP